MAVEGKSQDFTDRRQRRIHRRRGEILAAAARVLGEKGFANTTTREIAEAADVAEGTLYNYFPSKREILLAIANETEAPMETALMAAGPIQDRAALVDLVDRALDIPPDQLAFMRTSWGEAWVDDHVLYDFVAIRLGRIHHLVADIIRARVKQGTFRTVEPDLAAQMIIGMFVAVIAPVVRGLRPPAGAAERRTLAEAIAAMILDGLQPDLME